MGDVTFGFSAEYDQAIYGQPETPFLPPPRSELFLADRAPPVGFEIRMIEVLETILQGDACKTNSSLKVTCDRHFKSPHITRYP